ncbi:FtsK/SpoIIIE domain-containing protein [Paenarthrobacter sp. NPDC089675]|uniref:FtsK/SpoIIIE domain-containing protein n=1 Tax=Paenarthrobacter sp. NPDC089675 TaxID=3364376 RepID=UPI003811C400
MALECTLVRGPMAKVASDPEELTIDITAGRSGLQLAAMLEATRGVGRLAVSGQDVCGLTVGVPPLVTGAVLVDLGAVEGTDAKVFGDTVSLSPAPPALLLLAHSGPAAGTIFPLERGLHRLGRDVGEIRIPDPDLSRAHALINVSETALELAPRTARTLVLVDEKRLRGGAVTTSSAIRCGNSTLSIMATTGSSPALSSDAGRSVTEAIEVKRPTLSGSKRWVVAAMALLPLLASVGLAVATGMWTFLALTAASAASMLIPALAGQKVRREFQETLRAAVQQDDERRRRSAPSAAGILLHALRTHGMFGYGGTAAVSARTGRDVKDPEGVWLRLGTSSVPANIRLAPEDPSFTLPAIESSPVALDPAPPCIAVVGRPEHVAGLVRFMLMQLAAFPSAAESPVILVGATEHLPTSARFLRNCTLAAGAGPALTVLEGMWTKGRGRIIVLDPAFATTEGADALLEAAKRAGWQVLRYLGIESAEALWAVEVDSSGVSARLQTPLGPQEFIPDQVPERVFDRFCRVVSSDSSSECTGHGAIPRHCSLEEMLPTGPRGLVRRWNSNERPLRLEALLGRNANGPHAFDFLVDGPHLLVAGTTGSGKSELLRTMVASLASTYSPDQLVFLLIDFKGGSGLGPLRELPHTVGLLTDLASHDFSRALTSLRSEVRRREELFAAAGAAGLRDYQQSRGGTLPVVPYMMVVIDEFRMLVDQAPAALAELMRIATIGRSLGIHLVMATQRPQGAVTADIRANVTSSIALRVQSDAESMDVINSKAAAAIGVDQPGRAFLVRASGKPEEFQSAFLAGADSGPSHPRKDRTSLSRVRSVEEALESGVQEGEVPPGRPGAGVERLVSAVRTAWSSIGGRPPRQPIAPPLPAHIPWDFELPSSSEPQRERQDLPANQTPLASGALALGLLDRPEEQTVRTLDWSPEGHGHLAMIGGQASGMPGCFLAVAAQLAVHPGRHHLYLLDATGILGALGTSEGYGATVGLDQLPLAVRVLERISEEMAGRRGHAGAKQEGPRLVLIVTGWCTWVSALRKGPFAWAEDMFRDIIRDGTPLGVTVLVCGERELVGSRFFASIPNRAFFPLGASDEARFHWPRMPETAPYAGRAVAYGTFVSDQPAVTQFRSAPREPLEPASNPDGRLEPPFLVRPLPTYLTREDFLASAVIDADVVEDRSDAPPLAWIGLGGDAATPVRLPLRFGGVSLIVGGPGSGKTCLLDTLESLNPGVAWIRPGRNAEPGAFWQAVAEEAGGMAPGARTVCLIDDADSLDSTARHAIGQLAASKTTVVMTATAGPALLRRLPLAEDVQTTRMGLILNPQGPLDGDVFGLRVHAGSSPLPGRGVAVAGNTQANFQAAYCGHPPSPK